MSIALVAVTLAAVVGALFFADAIRGPAVSVGNLQGTALVLGVVTVPVLLASMILAIETASIGVDQWMGHAADPSSPAASRRSRLCSRC